MLVCSSGDGRFTVDCPLAPAVVVVDEDALLPELFPEMDFLC